MNFLKQNYLKVLIFSYAVLVILYASTELISLIGLEVASLALFLLGAVTLGNKLKIFLDEFEELKAVSNKDR